MRRTSSFFVVSALILIGFGLRLFHINAISLRGDEAFTVMHWMREPLADTLANIATVDPQAPLSYALFHGWGLLVGTGELTARFLPALLNLLGIPVLYALGKRLGGRTMGYVAALLWALHPYQIWHAQDARNYAIWAALSPLAAWLALRAIDQRRPLDWALYVIAAACAGYIYYLELFSVFVLTLFVFLTRWRDRRVLAQWVGALLALGVILAPWYLQERLLFGSGYGGTTGRFDAPQWLTWFVPTLTFGETLPDTFKSFLWIGLLIALVSGLIALWRHNRRYLLWIALLGTVPLLLLGIVSTRLNVFTPRYVLTAAPAYTLILAALIAAPPLRSRAFRQIIGGLVFAAALGISAYSLYHYYFEPMYFKAPDWRALTRYLSEYATDDDLIVQAAADEAFTFYFGENNVAGDLIYLPANPRQSEEEIEQILAEQTAAYNATWYVAEAPSWINRSVPINWLTANLQLVRDTSIPRLPIRQFMAWENVGVWGGEPLATFTRPNGEPLVGVLGSEWWIEPDEELTLWVYWQPLGQTMGSLKTFVHLIGADPQPITQDDQFPQEGHELTATWEIGSVYRDVYTLPLGGVSPGTYQLLVGWYDPVNAGRMPTPQGDTYTLGSITIP